MFPFPTPQQGSNKPFNTRPQPNVCFILDLTVVYLFHDAYVLVTDYLLHRILIKARIVLEMTFLLMAKQLQCWCFDICNVIEVWLLWDYSAVDIITICYHNGLVFDTLGCIYIIWMTMDAIHRSYGQKLQTNSIGS